MTSLHAAANATPLRPAKPKNRHHRRDTRIAIPVIKIQIDDRTYRTIDWGLGGFLVEPYFGELRTGDGFLVTGIGPGDGEPLAVAIPARVVRAGEHRLAACFWKLNAHAYSVIEALIMRRRGFGARAGAA